MRELSRPERLLALFKVWGVLCFLDPHKELATGDWETALPEFIPKVESAASLPDFYYALCELGARLNDGHVRFAHPSLVLGRFNTIARINQRPKLLLRPRILPRLCVIEYLIHDARWVRNGRLNRRRTVLNRYERSFLTCSRPCLQRNRPKLCASVPNDSGAHVWPAFGRRLQRLR